MNRECGLNPQADSDLFEKTDDAVVGQSGKTASVCCFERLRDQEH